MNYLVEKLKKDIHEENKSNGASYYIKNISFLIVTMISTILINFFCSPEVNEINYYIMGIMHILLAVVFHIFQFHAILVSYIKNKPSKAALYSLIIFFIYFVYSIFLFGFYIHKIGFGQYYNDENDD